MPAVIHAPTFHADLVPLVQFVYPSAAQCRDYFLKAAGHSKA